MKLTLIAAMDEARLIGLPEGGLPWEGLLRDVDHFRSYTAGKALAVGRKTFDEMRNWFEEGHRPIVLSRSEGLEGVDFPVVTSIEDALEVAEGRGEEELVVCGGASV